MAYSTISKSTSYMNPILYTGTGATNAITGVGFQPDLVWLKRRDGTGAHRLCDAVRGATKLIQTNSTDTEQTDADTLTAFDTDGFTLGSDASDYKVNQSGQTMVSWNFKANGSGSANGNGTISSTVSVDTTSGFSIVSYTGTGSNATVGHGLGVAPRLVITKPLASAQEWAVGTDSIGWGSYLFLNETSGSQSGSTYWQDTAPDANVFSIGTTGPVNSASAMIAYCFAEVKGFSKIGRQYIGNGNADGPYVYCGFKPAWVMIKREQSGKGWIIMDDKRIGYNPDNQQLLANASDAEFTNDYMNIYANGFKIIDTNGDVNTSANSYTYMAFGQPIVSTNNHIATAR